jgi:predicted DNA-binding protein (UPF0251 family)
MTFDEAVQLWLEKQIKESKGERRRRLKGGLTYSTTLFLRLVWWPAFRNFDHLYAEYEVKDFKDGVRYIDLVYIQPMFRIAIEIDGFGPHERDVTREDYADERDRQTDLCIDRWELIRFSTDRVKQKPRTCEARVRLMLDACRGEAQWAVGLSLEEMEIVRLARRNVLGIRRAEVEERLGIGNRTAGKLLHELVRRQILKSAESGRERIHRYMLVNTRLGKLLIQAPAAIVAASGARQCAQVTPTAYVAATAPVGALPPQ